MQVLLCKTKNDVSLFLYKEILKKNGIPFELREKHLLYVNEELYDKALLATKTIRDEEIQRAQSSKNEKQKRKWLAIWISILFIGIPLLYLVYHNFLK